jgi:hypothetical protein
LDEPSLSYIQKMDNSQNSQGFMAQIGSSVLFSEPIRN